MTGNRKAIALRCEPLEHRDNPAGNVSAALIGGSLILNGDVFDNQFSVQQNPAGDLFVFGLNGTLVNGQSAIFVGRGTLNNLFIDSGAGNDYLEILGVATPGWVWVDTGFGNDGLFIGSVSAGIMHLHFQDGNDGLVASSVFVNGPADFNGGPGADGFDRDGVFAGGGLFVNEFETIH